MLRKNVKPVQIPQCRGKPGEEYIYLQKACSERTGNLCKYPSVGEKPGEEYIYLQKACSERTGNLCEYPSVGENQVRNIYIYERYAQKERETCANTPV